MTIKFSIPGLMEMQSPVSDALEEVVMLAPHDRNNTNWIGIASIGPTTINDEQPPYPAEVITMEFWQPYSNESLLFSSDPGGDGIIIIEDDVTWEFSIPSQPLDPTPGLWNWEVKVKNSQDNVTPLSRGQIIIKI
jgi:hypothetical protein